jgi:hypothetical protein
MKSSLEELLELYSDLERTLRRLSEGTRKTARAGTERAAIDVRKLVRELSRAKTEVEQRIHNKLLVERERLKRRIGNAHPLPGGRILTFRRRQQDEDDGAH